ncbi:MAG TPA: hypothetical protein VER96_00700 [Polyangiaceae bacterium]|nr:hypothetical protein [Polyangiaceae bacterium]
MGQLRIGVLGGVIALVIFGCGDHRDAAPVSASHHDFRPVATLQPTESGAWVVDPSDPLTLYAIGWRSMRSRDGGRTWAELNWPGGARALHFAHAPKRALYLEVDDASDSGGSSTALPLGQRSFAVFKSLDEGKSWSSVGRGVNVLLLEQSDGPALLQVGGRISRSVDDGQSWQDSELPSEFSAGSMTWAPAYALAGQGGSAPVFVVGSDSSQNAGRFMLVSSDGGASFASKALPDGVLGLRAPTLSLDCLGRLYVLANDVVYRSSDAGTTWDSLVSVEQGTLDFRVVRSAVAHCGDSIHASALAASGVPQLLTIDAAGGLTAQDLSDNGELWELGEHRLLLVPNPDQPIAQGVRPRLGFGPKLRSDDDGRTWWPVGVSLAYSDLPTPDLVLSSAQPGLVFVAAEHGVYRSRDAGRSWQSAAGLGRAIGLYPDPSDANVLYAGTSQSPWSVRSTDGGDSFQDWPVPSRERPERLLAVSVSASGSVTVVTEAGVYRREAGGSDFSPELSGQRIILQAAIGAGEPAAIYLIAYGLESGVRNEAWSSFDGGATWNRDDLDARTSDTYISCLFAHPAQPEVAFACGENGLLRTTDGGMSWLRLPTPNVWSAGFRIDPLPPHAMYAFGQQLLRSDDQGDTWQALAEMPPHFGDFELSPHPDRARYALGSSGVLYDSVE